MTTDKRRRFPWRKGSVILIVVLSAMLIYDCRKHGSFQASGTGKFLKEKEVLRYGQEAWQAVQNYTAKGLEYVEATSPEYYKATVEFSKPYVKLSSDLYLIVKNASFRMYNNAADYAAVKGPLVAQTIEHYAPGLVEQVQLRSVEALQLLKTYSAYAADQAVEKTTLAIRYLETNVFVGNLSPKNLQSYASRAIDTTQSYASQTYDWLYEKVQTLSKVQ